MQTKARFPNDAYKPNNLRMTVLGSAFRPRRFRRFSPLSYILIAGLIGVILYLSARPSFTVRTSSQECVVDRTDGVLDFTLAEGPDEREILGRESAKQPRDFDQVWDTVQNQQRWHRMERENAVTLEDGGPGFLEEWTKDEDLARKLLGERALRNESDQSARWEIARGHFRVHHKYGRQTFLHFRDRNNKKMREYHHRGVMVTKDFSGSCRVKVRSLEEWVHPMYIVLPYGGRPNRLRKFLAQFASHASRGENLRLIVAVLADEAADVERAVEEMRTKRYIKRRMRPLIVKGDKNSEFSRAVAIREAVNIVPRNSVIFVSDVDLKIDPDFWTACRLNTVLGAQAYFPIFFSLYPYGKGIWGKHGFWRKSSYGMVCMYRDDFNAVGGFGGKEESAYSGWGGEDVVLYNKFRDNDAYGVLRAVEPLLLHKWHGKKCPEGEHYVNCMRTVYLASASQDRLAKLVADESVEFSAITKDAEPE